MQRLCKRDVSQKLLSIHMPGMFRARNQYKGWKQRDTPKSASKQNGWIQRWSPGNAKKFLNLRPANYTSKLLRSKRRGHSPNLRISWLSNTVSLPHQSAMLATAEDALQKVCEGENDIPGQDLLYQFGSTMHSDLRSTLSC